MDTNEISIFLPDRGLRGTKELRQVAPGDSSLGVSLRLLRKNRGLSLGQLAERSGVSRSSLSRWESRPVRPRPRELVAVLGALGVSQVDKDFKPEAPWQKEERHVPTCLPLPRTGDLLRALRLRSRRSQQEIAREIGVSRATVARWESCAYWPKTELLNRLCVVLRTTPAESSALLHGPILETGSSISSDMESAVAVLTALNHGVNGNVTNRADLHFLGVECRLEPLAATNTTARILLGEAYRLHANYLFTRGRYDEAEKYVAVLGHCVYQIPDQFASANRHTALLLHAVILLKRARYRRNLAPVALQFLEDKESFIVNPEFRAWFETSRATALALMGRRQESEVALRNCLDLPCADGSARGDDTETALMVAYLNILNRRYDSAYAACAPLRERSLNPEHAVRLSFRLATLAHATGDTDAQNTALEDARNSIRRHGTAWFIGEWEHIARQPFGPPGPWA